MNIFFMNETNNLQAFICQFIKNWWGDWGLSLFQWIALSLRFGHSDISVLGFIEILIESSDFYRPIIKISLFPLPSWRITFLTSFTKLLNLFHDIWLFPIQFLVSEILARI